jgi:NAD(P)-dependent dehydrogenase (short-subunit alcohol dehydrogenase family)
MGLLDGKVAIITGAAGGLGRGAVAALLEDGASVIAACRTEESAKNLVEDFSAVGNRIVGVPTDVGAEADVKRLVETAVEKFGHLNILVNNAAATSPAIFGRDTVITDLDPEVFAETIRVNLIGYALGAKHAIPQMIAAGGGVIINTSSVDGIRAPFGRAMYAASKSAVDALTRSIATQYGRRGIRAVGISPGPIITEGARRVVPKEMIDRIERQLLTPRSGLPEDFGYLAAFLASDRAGYLTGLTIQLDGGISAHWPDYAEELASVLASDEPDVRAPSA